jgi:hypothetical protein
MNNNQDNNNAKVHGSGSMFVDAAIEALKQERANDKEFSYLLITNKGNKCGQMAGGKKIDLCSAIASQMEDDEDFEEIIQKAVILYECHKNPKKMLNELMGILDKAIEKSKENPSDAFKGFMDRIKNKKNDGTTE